MNLLAIDAAGPILGIAVERGGDFFYEEIDAGVKHSELVMDCVDRQMKKACLYPRSLDGVLCMKGPGSFTGLRIGYSIAKGLALSLSISFVPIPTLDCIALSCPTDGLLIPVIEARKNAWFFCAYRNGKRVLDDMDSSASEIAAIITAEKKHDNEKIFLLGQGSQSLYNSLPEEAKNSFSFILEKRAYAKELIYIAKENNIFAKDNGAFLYSGPEYLRKTDAEIDLAGKAG